MKTGCYKRVIFYLFHSKFTFSHHVLAVFNLLRQKLALERKAALTFTYLWCSHEVSPRACLCTIKFVWS